MSKDHTQNKSQEMDMNESQESKVKPVQEVDRDETVAEKSDAELAAEYLNDLKRVTADFDNYKKRLANEQKELSVHLTRAIISDLVPILDNFHAAITHVPKESEGSPWVTGITYIERQFEDVLKNYGVEPLDAKPGDHFNPALHEAIEHKDSSEKKEKLVIEKVLQKGYKIQDKIIRAAKVIVT